MSTLWPTLVLSLRTLISYFGFAPLQLNLSICHLYELMYPWAATKFAIIVSILSEQATNSPWAQPYRFPHHLICRDARSCWETSFWVARRDTKRGPKHQSHIRHHHRVYPLVPDSQSSVWYLPQPFSQPLCVKSIAKSIQLITDCGVRSYYLFSLICMASIF